MATYYENITETVCYLNPSNHRRKLFRYRNRAKYGKHRPFLARLNEARHAMSAAKPAGGE